MNVLLTVSSNLCKQFVDKHGTSLGIKARYFSTESLIKKLRTTSSRPGPPNTSDASTNWPPSSDRARVTYSRAEGLRAIRSG